MMLLNTRRKKTQDGSFSVFRLYVSDHALVQFATQFPSFLIMYLPARNTPFCLLSRAEAGTGACVVRLYARLAWLATGCHCLIEINFGRLKTPDTFLACMLEVAGFILNLSSPSVPSVDGVLKNICEWVAFVLDGFWKMFSGFLKT